MEETGHSVARSPNRSDVHRARSVMERQRHRDGNYRKEFTIEFQRAGARSNWESYLRTGGQGIQIRVSEEAEGR